MADRIEFLATGKKSASRTVVLAHGAGAPMDSLFMNDVAERLAARDARVVRFEFPYMAARRTHGTRKGPDRAPVLLETWRTVIAQAGEAGRLVIGGKSMGGRIATMVADEAGAAGVLCFGYPFHPPGRPAQTRTEHLRTLETPTLILQGTRDSLGNREDVEAYALSPAIAVHWLADGDHDLKPRKASGRTHEQNIAEAIERAAAFLERL